MLKISELNLCYNQQPVIKNLSLELEPGFVLAVVGESGTGKTSLGLSVMGLIPEISSQAQLSGHIHWKNQDILQMPPKELQKVRWQEIAMVFQNVDNAFNPAFRLFQQVQEPLTKKGVTVKEANQRTVEMLEKVGIPQRCFHAYPHQLSIGERQRALIAMAFICDPELVILDEPFSAVDLLTQKNLITTIKELSDNIMLILITHDLAIAAQFSHETAVLYGGRFIERAPTNKLLSEPLHPYSRGLIRSFPDMSRSKDLQGIKGNASYTPKGCVFHTRCTQSIAICSQESPGLKNHHTNRQIACHRGGITPILKIRGYEKSFASFQVIKSLDLTLYEGETVALVGPSGTGKTTLAKMICGIIKADKGEVLLDNEKITQRDPSFYKNLQMIFQNPREALSHRMNVFQALKEPLDIQRVGTQEERAAKVKAILKEVEMPNHHDFLHRYPHELSGGEVQRLVIARALILNPRILIADEPTSALDCSIQAKIVKNLNQIQEKRGLSILFITHNIALAKKISDRIIIFKSGQIIESGLTSRVLTSPAHPFTRGLLRAAPVLLENLYQE